MGVPKVRCSHCKEYFDRDEMYLTMPVGRYCSQECVDDHRRTKPKKKLRADYQIPIRKRDGHCRCCGQIRGTQVHHIVFRGQGGSDEHDNLILLCQACHHVKAHGPKSIWYRRLFQEYIRVLAEQGRKLSIPEIAARLLANSQISDTDNSC